MSIIGSSSFSLLISIPSSFSESNISLIGFSVNLVISIFLSMAVAYLYSNYGGSLSNRRDFSSNFSLLSMTTMLIITIVKSSLALSLGLVGALSIVRFRTAIKEPEELVYLFLCIAIGLGLGANQTLITFIGFIIVSIYIVLSSKFRNKSNERLMNLILNVPNTYEGDLENIIDLLRIECIGIKLKRLSDNSGDIESILTIEVSSYKNLIEIRNKLNKIYPNIGISFLDSSGLSTF